MHAGDLAAGQAMTAALGWPHRAADWEQAFRLGEGRVAVHRGEVVGTAMRWRWGPRHATLGLIVVSPAWQGRGVGRRLVSALLEGLEACGVLLHATPEGRGLYERLGFVHIGGLRQHQGTARHTPPVALPAGWRLRPAGSADTPTMAVLDAQARGMPRAALIAALAAGAAAAAMLEHEGRARGFGLLRRFGRGHSVGPVVAGDAAGARALVAHLAGLNAGHFTRIDVGGPEPAAEWLAGLGLPRVDDAAVMVRGPVPVAADEARLFALATQSLG